MPTKNPRIHITMDSESANLLSSLAEQENKSVSSLSLELILEALDRREDMALSSIAEARDTKDAKLIDHDDAWK